MPKSDHEPHCEPKGTKEREEYIIMTKLGTTRKTFESFIKTLPDGGKREDGKSVRDDEQSYLTYLTCEEAKKVAQNDFIDLVLANRPAYMTFDMDQGTYDQTDLNFRLTQTQLPHLGILSSPPGTLEDRPEGEWSPYCYDPTLGKDQTIYILDTGFNWGHEQFAGDRTRAIHVIPNSITLRDVDSRLWPPECDHTDFDGHGTMVASVAVGKRFGVASNANLVLVKMIQSHWDSYDAQNRRMISTHQGKRLCYPEAVRQAWEWVVDDVLVKRSHGHTGKSIVCMCASMQIFPGRRSLFEDIFRKALEKCWKHDIITVVSAGNRADEGMSLDKTTPQNLGTKDNALITVGGVTNCGALFAETSLDRGMGGSITVYAVAEQVHGAYHSHSTAWTTRDGTSFAAPAVAGLCAYFAGLPSLAHEWKTGSVAMDMKRYIADHALPRAKNPIPLPLPVAYYQAGLHLDGSTIKVAYNRVYDGLSSWKTPSGERNSFVSGIDPSVAAAALFEAVSTTRESSSGRDEGRERQGHPGKRPRRR